MKAIAGAGPDSNCVPLGAIIEKVSGVSFDQFVKTNLFGLLGMTSTSCEGRFDDVPGLATAYEPARTPEGQLDWSSRCPVSRTDGDEGKKEQ